MIFEPMLIFVALFQVFPFLIEGITGFGGSVVGAPFNAAWMGVENSVPFNTLLAMPILIYTAAKCYKQCNYKELIKILLILAPGFLLGNYFGTIVDAASASVLIGGAVTLIALINCYKHIFVPFVLKKPVDEDKPDTMGQKVFRYFCLICGSLVHGAFTIGGPLVTVYTINAVKDKYAFRSTMITMWVFLDAFNSIRMGVTGRYTPYVLTAVALAVPVTFFAYWLGFKILHKVNREQFLRIVYIVLLGVGLNMFIRNIVLVLA